MINTGELNRQITFQTESGPQDSYGAAGGTWSDTAIVWAGVITTGGREFYAAQKLNSETTAVFKIRYRTGLVPTMQIKYGTRYFNILNINDVDEGHREMLITCKEVV